MHAHNNDREKNIKTAAFLNISFTIIEIIGGFWTNSIAILADALHDFGDSVALITSLVAEKKAKQPADSKRTYGYQRLSLFSALFSAVILVTGSIFILSEAIPRLMNPEETNAVGMIWLAIIGIVMNGLGMLKLRRGQSQNEKVLTWHLMEDVLGWVVILIGAVVMYFWDATIIDPIMTVAFTAFVLWGVARNLKGTLNIFMQGVPYGIDISKIKKALLEVDGVINIHDIHIWSLDGEVNIFSGHIVVKAEVLQNPNNIKKNIKGILNNYQIKHSTLELESEDYCTGMDCESND